MDRIKAWRQSGDHYSPSFFRDPVPREIHCAGTQHSRLKETVMSALPLLCVQEPRSLHDWCAGLQHGKQNKHLPLSCQDMLCTIQGSTSTGQLHTLSCCRVSSTCITDPKVDNS
eukprot:scpid81101/ scgid15320/ 